MIIILIFFSAIINAQEKPVSQILTQSNLVRFERIIEKNLTEPNDLEFENLLSEKPQVLYREGLSENLLHLLIRKKNVNLLNKTISYIDNLSEDKQNSAFLYTNTLKENPLMLSVRYRSNEAFIALFNKLKENSLLFFNSINAEDLYKQNILHYAVMCGNELALNLLIQETATYRNRNDWINSSDITGRTSFYKATEIQNLNFMNKLLESECDINIPNSMGTRPIDLARNSENQELKNFFGLKKSFFNSCFAHVRFKR